MLLKLFMIHIKKSKIDREKAAIWVVGGANLTFYEYQVFEWQDAFAKELDHERIDVLPQNTGAGQLFKELPHSYANEILTIW